LDLKCHPDALSHYISLRPSIPQPFRYVNSMILPPLALTGDVQCVPLCHITLPTRRQTTAIFLFLAEFTTNS
jgi:hypothetical protein